MSYPIFTAIFLDEASKSSVESLFNISSIQPEYGHKYCTHVTISSRPDHNDVVLSESGPWGECYITDLIQDPYIQTFRAFVPFSCKKTLTHLTYAIEDDLDYKKYAAPFRRPICKPCYSNHLLRHVRDVEKGILPHLNDGTIVTSFRPLRIKGILSTIRKSSPHFSGIGSGRMA